MATFKHISSKNADYGAAEQYLTFEHDEFTMKPTLDENGRLMLREDYRIATLNCGDEDFAVACMRSNLRYGKNQKREDVKSHHYIISFDPRDATDNGLVSWEMLGTKFLAQCLRPVYGQTIRPIVTVSPVNDELLSAVGRLTAEYGKIGGNLNQIARALNEYGTPYNTLSVEVRAAISDLAALKFEVLRKVGDAVGNIQAYQL